MEQEAVVLFVVFDCGESESGRAVAWDQGFDAGGLEVLEILSLPTLNPL